MIDKEENSSFLYDILKFALYIMIFAGQCFALSIIVNLIK